MCVSTDLVCSEGRDPVSRPRARSPLSPRRSLPTTWSPPLLPGVPPSRGAGRQGACAAGPAPERAPRGARGRAGPSLMGPSRGTRPPRGALGVRGLAQRPRPRPAPSSPVSPWARSSGRARGPQLPGLATNDARLGARGPSPDSRGVHGRKRGDLIQFSSEEELAFLCLGRESPCFGSRSWGVGWGRPRGPRSGLACGGRRAPPGGRPGGPRV